MTLPVIANVIRCAIHWSNVGGTGVPASATNVLHFRTTTESEKDLSDKIAFNLGTYAGDALAVLSSAFQLTEIVATKLDGTSGGVVSSYTGVSGQSSGQFIPQGCEVMSLATGTRGPQGRGRIYIGPVAESAQENGGLIVGSADPGGGWNSFMDAMALDGAQLVVASYKHVIARDVVHIGGDPYLHTQRRRARH